MIVDLPKDPAHNRKLYDLAMAAFSRLPLDKQGAFLQAAHLVYRMENDQEEQQPGFTATYHCKTPWNERCDPFINAYLNAKTPEIEL